jgi:hypothetical protein
VIRGVDVGQLASAAAHLSGFTPSFSNSFIGRVSATTAQSDSKYSEKKSRISTGTVSGLQETYIDKVEKCCEFGIRHLIECNSRSSVIGAVERPGSTNTALGSNSNSSSNSSTQAPISKSQERGMFLCLETERGVYVYYPHLKHRTDSLKGLSRGSHQRHKSSDVSSSSWRQRSGENRNSDESDVFRYVAGAQTSQDSQLPLSRRDEDPNDHDALDEEDEEDEEDGGMWRDKDSEDEDSAEEDEHDLRLTEIVRNETRNTGPLTDEYSGNNAGYSLRSKRNAAKAGKSKAVSAPPSGAVWKLLSPSLHGIDVGKHNSPPSISCAANPSAVSLQALYTPLPSRLRSSVIVLVTFALCTVCGRST